VSVLDDLSEALVHVEHALSTILFNPVDGVHVHLHARNHRSLALERRR